MNKACKLYATVQKSDLHPDNDNSNERFIIFFEDCIAYNMGRSS
jgi:hypothetical protein